MATMNGHPQKKYSEYYHQISETPELSSFPRFTGEWAWLLHEHIVKILSLKQECEDAMMQSKDCPPTSFKYEATDWHPLYMGGDEEVKSLKERLQKAIRDYGKDSLIAYKVAQLPDQSELWASCLRNHSNIFDNGVFGPTGEDEARYKKRPADSDLWTIKGYKGAEGTTHTALRVFILLKDHVWLRIFSHRKDKTGNSPEFANLNVVNKVIDYLCAVFLPLLLTVALYCLDAVPSTEARIAVIGGFGMLAMLFMKAMSGASRSEILTFGAAYFAISNVFVTIKSDGNGVV